MLLGAAVYGCKPDPFAAPARELGVQIERATAAGMPSDPAAFSPRPVPPEKDLGPLVADYRGTMAEHRDLLLRVVEANVKLERFEDWETLKAEVLPKFNRIATAEGVGLSYNWQRAFLAEFTELPVLLLIRGDLYDLAISATLSQELQTALLLERHLARVNQILARYPHAAGYLQAITGESLRMDLLALFRERFRGVDYSSKRDEEIVTLERLRQVGLHEMFFAREFVRQLTAEEIEANASADPQKRQEIAKRPVPNSDPADLKRQAWLARALQLGLTIDSALASREALHEKFQHIRTEREAVQLKEDPTYQLAKSDQIADLVYYYLRYVAQRNALRIRGFKRDQPDPFTDEPLISHLYSTGGQLVYSVGPNGIDDDGPNPGKTDDIGFRIPRTRQGAAPVPRLENPMQRVLPGAPNEGTGSSG